ncbi:MAG TPA: hypothetical protein VMF09_11710 [Solirubrobacteraceae bacterium]|nr:hypothetical protein [Solirubrobacteraceae bacterium]
MKRACRLLARRRRALALALIGALALVLLAGPSALASDVYGNIGPAPQIPAGGLYGRYPLSAYQLDQFFPAIKVGLFSGIDTSGLLPMIAYFVAQVIWLITAFVSNAVITLFAFAFSLDLVNGNGSPGSGALAPVSQAIQNIYQHTFGQPWLIAAVALVSLWAMWKALVQRRYTETAGTLALSLVYCLIALALVTQPQATIAPASQYANKLSTALLSVTSQGNLTSEAAAKQAAGNQLFSLLVVQPWTVLEFGGIEHCTKQLGGKTVSVPVRPLGNTASEEETLASRLQTSTEVKVAGKTCINNELKYAAHVLPYAFQSKERNQEFEAIEHGTDSDLPEADPAKNNGSYPLGPADEPAGEAAGKGGQYERLLLSILIGIGSLGAWLLLGALAVGVLIAGVFLLMWLGFSPFALVIGVIPGRGHEFFRSWLSRLAGYLLRKVIYSAILAVVLAVCQALDDATSNLGWLMAFGLQALFLWAVFMNRDRIAGEFLSATAGSNAARDRVSRLQALYYTTRLARMAGLHRHHTPAAAFTRGHGQDEAVPPPTPEPAPRGADVPEPGDHVDEPIASSEGGPVLPPPDPEPADEVDEPIAASEAPPPIPDDPDPDEEPA